MPAGVYVLALQGHRRYVGSSRDIVARVETHIRCGGSAYTRKYPYESVVETFECDESKMGFVEDMYTKKYMAEFGIENVRGGAYCADVLSYETIRLLESEIISALGRCYKCGGDGHFAGGCRQSHTGRKYTCECCRGYTHTINDCVRAINEFNAAMAEYRNNACPTCGSPECSGNRCVFENYSNAADAFYDWARENKWIYKTCRYCGDYHGTEEAHLYCPDAETCACGQPVWDRCECGV